MRDRDERHRCLRRADFKQLQGAGTFQNDVPSGLPSSVLLRDTLFPAFVYVSEAKRSEVKSLSRVRLFATPWTVAYQALPPWDSPGKSTGVSLPFPSPGDLPDPGIKPRSPAF